MRFGSLFSGIGGFDLGFEQAGLTCSWQVEIDADCNRVLEKHWSGVARHKDVRDVGQLEPVDVICGGFPCQDLSVAGKRAGLAGERSGLWFEFLRIVETNRPEWVVIENVPGLFSSNEREDLAVILDGLEAAGYVFDLDVLDAQFYGVAQRRRRLFVVCQLAESLLKQKTISSALTIAQCLTENSLLVLIAARSPLATSLENLTFDAGEPNLSLKQRMTLFGMQKDGAAQTLAESLAVLPQSCGCELADSESNHGKNTPADSKTLRATRCPGSTPLTDAPEGCQNIERSWNPLLAECLQVMSECITSTRSSEITESRIYSCALLTLRIAERTILSPPSCPTFWSAALSTLTAMRAFTDYARQASSNLFTEAIWLQPWRNFVGQAVPVCESLGSIGVGSFEQVFPLFESVSWNPPTRGETRAGIAAPIKASPPSRRNGGSDPIGDEFVIAATLKQRGRGACDEVMDNLQVARPLKARANSSHDESHETYIPSLSPALTSRDRKSTREDIAEPAFVVTHTLRSEGADASEDGTGRGTPIVVANCFNGYTGGADDNDAQANHLIAFFSKDHGADAGEIAPTLRSQNFKDSHINGGGQVAIAFAENQRGELRTSDVSPQLSCAGGKPGSGYPAVAFTERTRAEGRTFEAQEELAYAITNPGSGGRTHSRQVAGQFGVRRLTPRECERLQSFPDDFTRWDANGKEISDSARYRMLGNAVCVNVAEWVGKRIMEAES